MTTHLFGQGRVVSERPVYSTNLTENRMVRIYLPPSYDKSPQRHYPVLYLHDGQNTFTTVGTNVAFGWGNWGLDATVNKLVSEKRIQEIIMVAVDCSAQRYLDYRGPAHPSAGTEIQSMKQPPPTPATNSRFEGYQRFLMVELKPKIDSEYRTMRDPAHTGIMGSSMGGICSVVMAWEHPEVFGNAASLSGAFQVEKRHFLANVLRTYKGKPKPCRVYLDSGAIDYTGGDDGRRDTAAVASELRRIGWREGPELEHFLDAQPLTEEELNRSDLRQDKWKEAQSSQHNEFYWRLRSWRPLVFLFPTQK